MANYEIKNIYQGSYSSLDPNKNSLSPSNYPIKTGDFGLTTDPRMANVLKEVSGKLSSGVKNIEVEGVRPEVFESMPNQDLDEVNRLAKLTGVSLSLHGPVVDSAGFGREGFSELNREASERRFIDTIERGHRLDPDGNIIINFHSAEGISGSQYQRDEVGNKAAKRLIVVNRENGKMAPLEPEKKYYPGGMEELKQDVTDEQIEKVRSGKVKRDELFNKIPLSEGKVQTPEDKLEALNQNEWDNPLNQLIFSKERADELLEKSLPIIAPIEVPLMSGQMKPKTPEQAKAYENYQIADVHIKDIYDQARGLFSKAYEHGDKNQKEALKTISEEFTKQIEQSKSLANRSQAIQGLLFQLKNPRLAPDMYVPLEEFAIEQSSKTFANAAFAGYKKFKDKAPIVSIENPPAGFALSTGEELRKLVEKTQERFVEKAREEGLSQKEAEREAKKLIGATWDVGHINMMRKFGGTKEDILRETEKIKPLLKHVHLSDNFGLEHTELPMGMGNVPIKDMMERLGKEGFEAKKIIEAGNWWQHFQSAPVQQTFEAFGSPIYAMQMAPYWNQTSGLQQGYFSGYGQTLPPTHFQMYGAGFSMASLPTELGGQMPGGGGSRMSGRGME